MSSNWTTYLTMGNKDFLTESIQTIQYNIHYVYFLMF